ncbi:MAG: hypothetical protein WBO88_03085 [Candidatus Dechloromonas phosphoritropha]
MNITLAHWLAAVEAAAILPVKGNCTWFDKRFSTQGHVRNS